MDETKKTDSDRFLRTFGVIWSAFSMSYIAAISFIEIPAENVRFVDTIIGFLLGTIVSGIIQFFYGSSLGSKEKNSATNS